ncbi:MAG: hypothetical protein K0U57_07580 [Alphaproteobacteria bacterium]|nr:hypothetical protein [Alphaproteobacteria bacterium]
MLLEGVLERFVRGLPVIDVVRSSEIVEPLPIIKLGIQIAFTVVAQKQIFSTDWTGESTRFCCSTVTFSG